MAYHQRQPKCKAIIVSSDDEDAGSDNAARDKVSIPQTSIDLMLMLDNSEQDEAEIKAKKQSGASLVEREGHLLQVKSLMG